MNKKWIKAEPAPAWDYKINKELEGIYLSKEDNIGPNGSVVHNFEQGDGTMISVWGNAVLNARLQNIKFGTEVKIVYLGKTKSEKSGRQYHNFEVWYSSAKPEPEEEPEEASDEVNPEDVPF